MNFESINSILFNNSNQYFSIHNWGNGDYDCIDPKTEQVLFYNHETGNFSEISDSFFNWLNSCIKEIKEYNVLFHPMDLDGNQKGFVYSDIND